MIEQFKLIAHRGASGYAPENTISAFKKALDMGMDFFEFDIQQTLDGQLIVYHDYMVKNTTTQIKDLTFKQVLELQTPEDKACTLKETLDLFIRNEIINIEIKNRENRYPLIAKETAALIKTLAPQYQKRLLISSFNFSTLEEIRALLPEIKIGLLPYDNDPASALKKAKSINCFSIHPSTSYVTEKNIKLAHDHGYKVYVYTVNTKERALELKAMNADGIFTNYPDLLTK